MDDLNQNIVNKSTVCNYNTSGVNQNSSAVGGVNLNNNHINNIVNNRNLDYINYHETNNNATGESKYPLANGHKYTEEVRLTCHFPKSTSQGNTSI